MKESQVEVGQLTDWEIARMLMFYLWDQYSASGVNHGRSLRAHLLEIIVFSTGKPEIYLCVDTLVAEVERRKTFSRFEQLVLNYGQYWLPEHYYFCYVLRAIHHWYATEAFDRFGPVLVVERNIIDSLCSIMQVNCSLRQFDEKGIVVTVDQIIDLSREFAWERTRNQYEVHYYSP